MTTHAGRHSPVGEGPARDPWRAFCQTVAGVLLYGGLGWLADRWLGTTWLVAVGVVVGCSLGLYLVFCQVGVRGGPERAVSRDSGRGPDVTNDDQEMPC